MAFVKALTFVGGKAQQVDFESDSLYAKSFKVGGSSGTELTKAILDTLIAGVNSEASSLHQHDGRYYRKNQYVSLSTGLADAAKPIVTNSQGVIDTSLLPTIVTSHSDLTNLGGDDHPQYLNNTRGDTRYFKKDQFVSISSGISSADQPVKLNSSGLIDMSMVDQALFNHESIGNLLGGAAGDHYHLTQTQKTTLTDGSDASTLHNHASLYAPIVHNHDSAYAPLTHNHDGVYAPVNHSHDSQYAPINHNHDGQYLSETEAATLVVPVQHYEQITITTNNTNTGLITLEHNISANTMPWIMVDEGLMLRPNADFTIFSANQLDISAAELEVDEVLYVFYMRNTTPFA